MVYSTAQHEPMRTLNFKDAFPSYITSLLPSHYPVDLIRALPTIIVVLVICFVGVSICLWFIRLRKMLQVTYTFLEIKPTDRTLKSPLSTNQLFTVLHSLEKQTSLLDRFLGIKRMVSCELVSTKKDGIRYVLRIPIQDASIMKKTLLAYLSGIEIKEVEDYISSVPIGKIKQLKLTKPYVYPLQDQSTLNQYDPIAYITAHMTKLDEDELIALQFICTPVHESTHKAISGHINELKQLLLNNMDITHAIQNGSISSVAKICIVLIQLVINTILFIVLAPITMIAWLTTNDQRSPMLPLWVFDASKGKRISDLGHQKELLYQSIQDKIHQPIFEVTIRLFTTTKDKESSAKRLKGMISSFDTFSSSYQSLQIKNSLLSFPQNRWSDTLRQFQLKERLSLFSYNPILSVSELSSLYHLPYTTTTKTEDLLQVKSPQLPAPLSLKKADTALDIIFANNEYGETITPIGLTIEERRRHAYIIGSTGTGKTTLLTQMIYQDILSGKGVGVIDPHGEFVDRLLGIIPPERVKDVIYLNPYDIEYPIGLNLLELPKGLSGVELQREKDFITSTLISVFHKLYDVRYSGPRMEHILRNVTLTALTVEKPTLFTIYKLLTNTKYRKQVVNTLQDEIIKSFWKDEFENLGSFQQAEMISPITNKLGRFLTTVMARNILNQPESKLDFSDIMDNKKILLCDLSKGKIGEDTSYFLGSLVIAKIQLAALRRIHIPQEKRTDFYLYIDEFQNFATASFAQVLSEARKYRLSAILAHQNTVQIEDDLLETIIGNSGTVISFRTTSPTDEEKLLPFFAPQVEKGQIGNLPSYTFYIKINALRPQDAFTGEIEDFTVKADESIRDEVIRLSQATYGTKVEVIEKQNTETLAPSKTEKKKPKNVNKFEETKK